MTSPMNVLPVITRELREQARQPFTYSLRVLGVLAMLGGTVYFVLELSLVRFRGALPNLGGLLFSFLQLALSAAIWILVPLGAADCISRERREGTLGLLFLTPLRALDIVVAKGLAHGLRAGTLWLAVLPVMMIPFLLGGVSWQRAVVSAELNFCSLCGALASALLASAISKSRLRAQAVAIFFSTAAVMVNAMFIGLLIVRPAPAAMRSSLDYTWLSGLAVFWVGSGPLGQTQTRYLLWGVGLVGIGSLIMLVGVMWFAAGMMRRNWRDEPPSVRAQRVTQVFCSPIVGQSFLRRWMRRTLMRNPIGWLEQRTWSGRMVTWVWLGIIVGIYSAVFTQPNFFRSIGSFQSLMGWLLAGSMGASAAGSFRRERETGVLELLLVSPLTTGRIIGGRLLGLWGQFFPSVALLLACWVYLGTVFPEHSRWAAMGYAALMFGTVPVIGLYFSLWCRSLLAAVLLTLGVGLLLPKLVGGLVSALVGGYWTPVVAQYFASSDRFAMDVLPSALGMVTLLTAAGLSAYWLHRRLRTRSFPLEPTTA